MNTLSRMKASILSLAVLLLTQLSDMKNSTLANRRSGSMGLIFAVVTIVVLGIVIILGALIFFAFGNALPTGLVTGGQVSTLATIISVGSSSLQLLEVLLIVAAAGTIIAGIFVYMAVGRRRIRQLKANEFSVIEPKQLESKKY